MDEQPKEQGTATNEPPVTPPVETQPQPADTVEQPASPSATDTKKNKPRPKWFMPLVVVAAVLIGGGAAAYLTVFSKSPQELFESALANTADGIETFLNIDNQQKGLKIDGKFDLTSPLAVDGTVSGQWYESNGSLTANVGVAGARVNAEVSSVVPEGASTPDIYFKVDGLAGLSGLLTAFGGVNPQVSSILSGLDNQWYVVDRTLVGQALLSDTEATTPELSEDELRQINEAVLVILRERLFGSEPDKAVFQVNEEIGKEDFEGTNTYKLNVGVNKDNFIAFLLSFESVVTDTKLRDVFEMSVPGQSIDDLFNFDDIAKSFEGTDFSQINADVWVEGNGRFIRNIRIYPDDNAKDTNYIDFMIPYEGGDVIPLVMRITLEDEDGKGVLTFGIDINQQNGDVGLSFDVDVNAVGQVVKATGDLSFTSTDEQVDVSAPSDARNVLELLGGLTEGLGIPSNIQSLEGLDGFGGSSTLDDFEIPVQSLEL